MYNFFRESHANCFGDLILFLIWNFRSQVDICLLHITFVMSLRPFFHWRIDIFSLLVYRMSIGSRSVDYPKLFLCLFLFLAFMFCFSALKKVLCLKWNAFTVDALFQRIAFKVGNVKVLCQRHGIIRVELWSVFKNYTIMGLLTQIIELNARVPTLTHTV